MNINYKCFQINKSHLHMINILKVQLKHKKNIDYVLYVKRKRKQLYFFLVDICVYVIHVQNMIN
jgi:hypothetical protein